ncbi:MAG: ABC transporter ATP-binding protein [Thermoleophilia bacterium]
MLELRDLTKRFGERVALDGLSLTVPAGQVVGLLGPNGSGKTTAMRVVFGVIDADEGAVTYRGAPIDAVVRRRFGYMPEERGLYPDMRVRDQLVYLARLAGLEKAAAAERSTALLERLGIADRADDQVQRLSLGNQQRVQLAAALVHDPEALVLDEPFSGLDPVAVASLSEIIREAAARGALVLFSSHQLDLVEDLCDSVRVIDHGRLLLEGRVSELQAASGRRELRVRVEGDGDGRWAEGMAGVRLVSRDASGVRLALGAGVDPLAVLDAARARGTVSDFGLQDPSLAELFLEAVERRG